MNLGRDSVTNYSQYRRRREVPSLPEPNNHDKEPINVECMTIGDRLNLIDQYVMAHPGHPVDEIVIELFPELHRLREQYRGIVRWHYYIGDLDDPEFCWDRPADALEAGKLPRRIIPREHYESVGVSVSFLIEQSRNGTSDCRKLDWGAWAWKLTGQELVEFFGPKHRHARAITALNPQRHYVLVAAEGV